MRATFLQTQLNCQVRSISIPELRLLMSAGIVALLFCGITLKHYAYYNMSRRTQLTTKYTFQMLAQLSENFIFIYLGLTLFTKKLAFKPLFILITVLGICAARYCAVFPLSEAINWSIRFRAKRRGKDAADELPRSHQVMLFWAGLRGAVGVALAAGLKGPSDTVNALQATVLVVVVLTVIIFGGTTARMLEIMGIRTGVVEEVDSDDEFDIETVTNGTYYKRGGTALGRTPTRNDFHAVPLGNIDSRMNGNGEAWERSYSSGHRSRSPTRPTSIGRKSSSLNQRDYDAVQAILLSKGDSTPEDDFSDSDLPPPAPRRSPNRRPSPPPAAGSSRTPYPTSGTTLAPPPTETSNMTATGAIKELFSGTADSNAAWFTQLDEGFIKPKLLLDQNSKGAGGGGAS